MKMMDCVEVIVEKKAYVEEEMFAYDDTVKSVKVDDKD